MLPPPFLPIIDQINARFHDAKAGSNALADAGVILHSWDRTEDPHRPWMLCSTKSDCPSLADRSYVSTSVVYAGKQITFDIERRGGVILNPRFAKLLCAYLGDGGTSSKGCNPPGVNENCVPGCWAGPSCWKLPKGQRGACWFGAGRWNDWCETMGRGSPGTCAWHPTTFGEMLRLDRADGRYNEIVLDAATWNAHLPESIEAFLVGDTLSSSTYAEFRRAYPQSRAPLLRYVPSAARDPFQLVRNEPIAEHGANPLLGLNYGRRTQSILAQAQSV